MISPRPWRVHHDGGEKLIVDKRGIGVAHYLKEEDANHIIDLVNQDFQRFKVILKTTGEVVALTKDYQLASNLVGTCDAEYWIREVE